MFFFLPPVLELYHYKPAEIHPETALAGSVRRFEQQFIKMEELVTESMRELGEVTLEGKKLIWEKLRKSRL